MQSMDYQVSSVIIYEVGEGGRQPKRNHLTEMNVLDQDFKSYLARSESLRRAFQNVMETGRKEGVTDDIASMFIEFALTNRSRFAIEQKIELAKCSESIPSLATKSNALKLTNEELDYTSGLLELLGSPGALRLNESVKQLRQCGLEELANIDDDEEKQGRETSAVVIEDDS